MVEMSDRLDIAKALRFPKIKKSRSIERTAIASNPCKFSQKSRNMLAMIQLPLLSQANRDNASAIASRPK